MAREKVLYDGHPVAAVAAVSEAIAREALGLIRVDYEVLPHVIDVVEAMKPDAPLLHEEQYTAGVTPKPDRPSNIAKRLEFALGDVAAGFAQADVIIEREFNTKPVHQGYIEPQACLASCTEDGQVGSVDQHAGPLRVSQPVRHAAADGRVEDPRDADRDRRRLRRQEQRLQRAAGDRCCRASRTGR